MKSHLVEMLNKSIIIIIIIIIIIVFRFHSLKLEIFLFTEGKLHLITSGL